VDYNEWFILNKKIIKKILTFYDTYIIVVFIGST